MIDGDYNLERVRNAIVMLRKRIVLVPNSSFFRKLNLGLNNVVFYELSSDFYLKEDFVTLAEEHQSDNKVAAIANAEYDHIDNKVYTLPNFMLTEFHDLEMEIFMSKALEEHISFHLNENLIEKCIGNYRGFRESILRSSHILGVFRYSNHKENLNLSFKFDTGFFRSNNSDGFKFHDLDKTIEALSNINSKVPEINRILRNLFDKYKENSFDLSQLCNGQDVHCILCCYLNSEDFQPQEHRYIVNKHGLSKSFNKIHFEKLDLAIRLNNWYRNDYGLWFAISFKRSGEGGQGKVLIVNNKDCNKKYAMKIYRVDRKKKKHKSRRFRYEREVKILKELVGHPNIIRYMDSGKRNVNSNIKEYYLVLELAERNLMELVESSDIGITTIFKIFEQILNGVKYFHSRDIVHRDLKPTNILLIEGVVKIIDFGISFSSDDEDRITQSLEKVGSKYYGAPELEEGRIDNNCPRIDIYSLGKILYYLLSRGRIFHREKYCEMNYYLPNLLKDNRYEVFTPIFDKSIQYDRNKRFKDVDQFIKSLRKCKKKFRV